MDIVFHLFLIQDHHIFVNVSRRNEMIRKISNDQNSNTYLRPMNLFISKIVLPGFE